MDNSSVIGFHEFQEWFFKSNPTDNMILVMSIFFIASFLIVILMRKLSVPAAVGYIIVGTLLSVSLVNLIPFLTESQKEWYAFSIKNMGFISEVALAFVAFAIGGELSLKVLKKMGKSTIYISILQAIGAFILVFIGLILVGVSVHTSLIFGVIATATAPTATVMVIQEYKAKGSVTSMILAVVGIDDVIALLMYSTIIPIAYMLYSGETNISLGENIMLPLIEILGSCLVGFIIGYVSLKLFNGIEDKTSKILLILSVLLCGIAVSNMFHLSALLTNMAVGFTYKNFAKKNILISDFLDTFATPLYAFFFILAATEINFSGITNFTFLMLALVFTFARAFGKIGGTMLGAKVSNASDDIKNYVGLGLLPQGGVAIAFAYAIAKQFSEAPEIGVMVFNIVLFTSLFTDIFGPILIKYALIKCGDAKENIS